MGVFPRAALTIWPVSCRACPQVRHTLQGSLGGGGEARDICPVIDSPVHTKEESSLASAVLLALQQMNLEADRSVLVRPHGVLCPGPGRNTRKIPRISARTLVACVVLQHLLSLVPAGPFSWFYHKIPPLPSDFAHFQGPTGTPIEV